MHLGAVAAIVVVIAMVGLSVSQANVLGNTTPSAGSASTSVVVSSASSSTPWTQPTTTMQEPGYTNGTYNLGATANVEHLNPYLFSDVYSNFLLQEVYGSAYNLLPNETLVPWLATSYKEYTVGSNTANQSYGLGLNANSNVTVDPLNGQDVTVKYIYQVTIRPGVQWTDYQSGSHTYTYSNTSTFNNANGNPFTVSYRFSPVTMNTYTVQAADFILSWEIMQSSQDFSGSYANIVNAIPNGNLTVDFYLSQQSATFLTYTLGSYVLPYHIFVHHDYSTTAGVWNYEPSMASSTQGYNVWNMNYSATTGTAPGLVGTGPYMFNGGYGMPAGTWFVNKGWTEYVNPHFWVQYTNSSLYRQWTPKFYEYNIIHYLSISSAVIALSKGQIYQIEGGVTSTFIPTVATIPHTHIFKKPTTGYAFMQLNSFSPQTISQVAQAPGTPGPDNIITSNGGYGFQAISSHVPLNETSVRQALHYAINKVYLASVIGQGYDIPGTSVVPNSDSFWQNTSLPLFNYNPSKAMSLLNSTPGMTYKNGNFYYNGVQFTMNIQITTAALIPLYVEQALQIAKWWDAVGVQTTVTQEAFSTLVSNLIDYGFQSIALGISGITGDPTGDYIAFYTPAGYGSGFFLGPYTNLTHTLDPNVPTGTTMTGAAVTQAMVANYTTMNTNLNLPTRVAAGNQIQSLAAYEGNMINVGYGYDLFPIYNATFTNTTYDTLSQTGFMYWSTMSLHLRSSTSVATPPSSVPTQLEVGVVANQNVYVNGQYGNVTVQVRNQYGSPVSGANVTIGVNPSGQMLNLTSYSGVTNTQGVYKLEFQIFNDNPIVYTADYFGQINISASATMNAAPAGTVTPGLGYTMIDVQSQPVAYSVVNAPALNTSKNTVQPLTLKVYNPTTGSPVSGYSLTLQSMAGVVNLTKGNNNSNPNEQYSLFPGNPYTENQVSVNFGASTSALAKAFGSDVYSVALTPNGTFAVVSLSSGYVQLLNLSSMTPGAKLAVTGAKAIATAQMTSNATSQWAFVTTPSGVEMVNLSSMSEVGTALLPTGSTTATSVNLLMNGVNDSFAFATAGSNVYVFNLTTYLNSSNALPTSPSAVATVPLGSTGVFFAFGASDNYAFVSTTSGVAVLNLTNVANNKVTLNGVMTLGKQSGASGLAVVGSTLYVADSASNNVTALNLVNMSKNTTLPDGVDYSFATNISVYTPGILSVAGDMLLVGNLTGSGVSAIALTNVGGYPTMDTNVTSFSTGGSTTSMVSAGGAFTLVANGTTGHMTVISNPGMALYANTSMDSVTGVTNSAGEFTVNLSVANGANPDFGLTGNLESYVFIGNYNAGAPVNGKSTYTTIAELTTANNPEGYGNAQPVEIPLQVTSGAPGYSIILTTSNTTIASPSGAVFVNVTVVNAAGVPQPNFVVNLVSQNAVAANRGYFSGVGNALQLPNVNNYFASQYLVGMQVTTDSSGQASVMFNAGLYTVVTQGGSFMGYSPQAFTDPFLVPADVFELSAVGVTHVAVSQTVVSSAASSGVLNNPSPAPVVSAYFEGAPTSNGVVTVTGGSSYTMYVNSTLATPAGPSTPNQNFTVSATYGTFSSTSNTTNANGTYKLTYTAPKVSVPTEVTITITNTATGAIHVEHLFVEPAAKSTSVSMLYYALIGVFAALFVIFAALYGASRGKKTPPAMKPPEPPSDGNQ